MAGISKINVRVNTPKSGSSNAPTSTGNTVTTGAPTPINKFGQPIYPTSTDAVNAVNDGSLTFGSSVIGEDGNEYYIDRVGLSSSGDYYPATQTESGFDWAMENLGYGDYIGQKFE